MKVFLLAVQTVRELILKATLLILTAISIILLLIVGFGTSAEHTPEGTTITVFGVQKSEPMPDALLLTAARQLEAGMTSGLFAGVILFGVLATAGIIPGTLEKGTADLYLSKPISRAGVLAGRTCGAVSALFANIVFFLGGLWLLLGLRVGVWDSRFLLAPLAMTFGFFSLYGLTTFFGVLSRSTAIGIIATFLFEFFLASSLANREQFFTMFNAGEAVRMVVTGLYYILPQTSDMQKSVTDFVLGGQMDWKPFTTSLLSSAGWYGLSWWIMENADF